MPAGAMMMDTTPCVIMAWHHRQADRKLCIAGQATMMTRHHCVQLTALHHSWTGIEVLQGCTYVEDQHEGHLPAKMQGHHSRNMRSIKAWIVAGHAMASETVRVE